VLYIDLFKDRQQKSSGITNQVETLLNSIDSVGAQAIIGVLIVDARHSR
jgi:hypothetical protein